MPVGTAKEGLGMSLIQKVMTVPMGIVAMFVIGILIKASY